MQTMLQLDPPIPVRTVKGDGFALGWFDYGIDYDTLWLVCITATAEMWQLPQSQVRGVKNISMGRVRGVKNISMGRVRGVKNISMGRVRGVKNISMGRVGGVTGF